MSQENVEIVRRVFEAVNRSWEPDLSLLDPDVILDTTNAVFDRAVYRGHEGVRQYLANQREVWESQRFEPEGLIAAGENRVIASFRSVTVGRRTSPTPRPMERGGGSACPSPSVAHAGSPADLAPIAPGRSRRISSGRRRRLGS